MNNMIMYIPVLAAGTVRTLLAWLLAGIMSMAIGIVFGVLAAAYFRLKFFQALIRLYVFIAKGVPAYVQILLMYFVVPSLVGINFPAFAAATVALGFCSSGYVTEIIRSGMNAIPLGQWQACYVLGYANRAALQRIILPQVWRIVLPAVVGELEQLLKSTSLLATIGVTELTRTGMNIVSRELNPLPIYGCVALMYLVMSAILNLAANYVEKRYGYR